MDSNALNTAIQSVVKIHAISNPPEYDQPWQTKGPVASTGSGVVIETPRGLRVLTNAHVTEYAAFLEVRRHGSPDKFVATVEGIGHDCDLALLAVEDEVFFEAVEPIELGDLPHLSDKVSACGFPIGGEHLSVTQGVVSRIELAHYVQSQRLLLAVQIDAAINSGNSGGPVLQDGRLAGVAFQALDEGQNIGYMIALPVVRHFLADLDAGRDSRFPDLGVWAQKLESQSHRRFLGLDSKRTGVLVTRVVYGSSAWGTLEPGDVLLAAGGHDIAADGTVLQAEGEQRLHFSHVFSSRHVGERVSLRIWRNGEEHDRELELRPSASLVREVPADRSPSYFVYGGLVFVPLTRDYLRSWGEDWWNRAPHQLLAVYEEQIATPERQEVVVLQKVLPDRCNQGYHEFEQLILRSVNGKEPANLAEVVELCDRATGAHIEFEGIAGVRVVLDRALVAERHDEVLERFGAKPDRSADLRA